MIDDELCNEYFDWMYQLVRDKHYMKNLSYRKLLTELFERDFYYILSMDKNRAQDGIDLRYRFGYECGYSHAFIKEHLDDSNVSVLEMMVALAFRCEEQIMDDPDIGNRTGQWFWSMIENLGLISMDDKNFDSDYINYVITRFLEREYAPNGEGGLFRTNRKLQDMRSTEIWYQLCWYLTDLNN